MGSGWAKEKSSAFLFERFSGRVHPDGITPTYAASSVGPVFLIAGDADGTSTPGSLAQAARKILNLYL